MMYNWIDPEQYTMETLLLFDRWILRYMLNPQHDKDLELEEYYLLVGKALSRYPHVRWYCLNKAPETSSFLEQAEAALPPELSEAEAREAEISFLKYHETFVVYAFPKIMEQVNYIRDWDPKWLDELIDLSGLVVLDIGAGTGRLSFAAAKKALRVYASEPCDMLREYMRDEIKRRGIKNMKVLDGFVDCLPYENACFDAVLSGHVVGDNYDAEINEMRRVIKPGGWIIICNGDDEFKRKVPNAELMRRGFQAFKHESPSGGTIFNYRMQVSSD